MHVGRPAAMEGGNGEPPLDSVFIFPRRKKNQPRERTVVTLSRTDVVNLFHLKQEQAAESLVYAARSLYLPTSLIGRALAGCLVDCLQKCLPETWDSPLALREIRRNTRKF